MVGMNVQVKLYFLVDYIYDVIVVGVGGVGFRVVIGLLEFGFNIVCIMKFFFMRFYIVVVQVWNLMYFFCCEFSDVLIFVDFCEILVFVNLKMLWVMCSLLSQEDFWVQCYV